MEEPPDVKATPMPCACANESLLRLLAPLLLPHGNAVQEAVGISALRPALTSCYAGAMAKKKSKRLAEKKKPKDLLMTEYIYEFAYNDFMSKIVSFR
jgi:hypothetical protein